MSDDVVDTIAQYDLDDDFPDYANEQNKELNQIVTCTFSFLISFNSISKLVFNFSFFFFLFSFFLIL